MFNKVIDFVKANKAVIIDKAATVVGVVAGLVVVHVIRNMAGGQEEMTGEEPSNDESVVTE